MLKKVRRLKYTLIFILSYLFIPSAQSQVLISLLLGDNLNTGKIEFGLDGGLCYSNIRGLDNAEYKSSFNLGFYFDIKLKNPSWMIHTGVIVKSNMGTSGLPAYSLNDAGLDSIFSGTSIERRINYFNVPIMIKYLTKSNIYWEIGIVPSLRANAYDIFKQESNGEIEYKKDIRNEIPQLDFGLMTGIGYRIAKGYGINLALRYSYGLVDISMSDAKESNFNEALYLAVGIPIGVKKAMARKAAKTQSEN